MSSTVYFRYGAMGSSKTANALMVRHNYIDKGMKPLMLKPRCENRDGDAVIKSRVGLSAECGFADDWASGKIPAIRMRGYSAVIVDESQFLTAQQVDKLVEIVDRYEIPIMFYGLRTDFQGHLFEGSRRLLEIADVIEEIPTVCWCGRKAQFNARIVGSKIAKDGDQIVLGGDEMYVSLCRKHFLNGRYRL